MFIFWEDLQLVAPCHANLLIHILDPGMHAVAQPKHAGIVALQFVL